MIASPLEKQAIKKALIPPDDGDEKIEVSKAYMRELMTRCHWCAFFAGVYVGGLGLTLIFHFTGVFK